MTNTRRPARHQTVPPSNINRDDTGSPKTATFGKCVREYPARLETRYVSSSRPNSIPTNGERTCSWSTDRRNRQGTQPRAQDEQSS